MTPEVKNYVDNAIRQHLHDGNYSQRVNLFDIFGSIATVSTLPTSAPSNIFGQFQIYNGQLYVYDFTNNVWRIASGGYFSVAKDTNGTTNVDVFGASGAPFAFTVTAVYLIAKDVTAGNITLLQGGNTVCTIAKGVVAGLMIGATSLANTVYAKGDVCQVDSSSAGNATVIIQFNV
jgi:hypothetical protein